MKRVIKRILIVIAILAGICVIVVGFLAIRRAIVRNGGDSGSKFYSLEEFLFEGDFNEFHTDMFEWYKSVEREDGVMLCNEAFYDKELFDIWRSNNVYENVPDESFWYIAASPSYLDEIGVNPLDGSIERAWEGVRLYLLPNTLDDNTAGKMMAFLNEDAQKNANYGGITNSFTERRETAFLEYSPMNENAPVYYVCTTENMTSFESESLIATGKDSYIRLRDDKVLERFKDDRVFTKYKLKFARG